MQHLTALLGHEQFEDCAFALVLKQRILEVGHLVLINMARDLELRRS